MSRNVVIIGIAIVLVMVLAGVYFINLEHRGLESQEPDASVNAAALFAAFAENEQTAGEKYLDKILDVYGEVNSIKFNQDSSYSILLETGDPFGFINASLDPSENDKAMDFQAGDEIHIRGVCTGMLLDVLLAKAVIIKP